jgi:hypothetical protein
VDWAAAIRDRSSRPSRARTGSTGPARDRTDLRLFLLLTLCAGFPLTAGARSALSASPLPPTNSLYLLQHPFIDSLWGESNRVESQLETAPTIGVTFPAQGSSFLSMALRITISFRMQAVSAIFGDFPARRKRWWNSRTTDSDEPLPEC